MECEEIDGGLVFEDLLSTVVLHVTAHVITGQERPGAPPLLLTLHGPQVEQGQVVSVPLLDQLLLSAVLQLDGGVNLEQFGFLQMLISFITSEERLPTPEHSMV